MTRAELYRLRSIELEWEKAAIVADARGFHVTERALREAVNQLRELLDDFERDLVLGLEPRG